MNYSDKTDFEINKMVAEKMGLESPSVQSSYGSIILVHQKGNCMKGEKTVDYCNCADDAWPIIVEHKISIECPDILDEFWYAFDSRIASTNENPLRAAMEVFLMMEAAK